MAVREQLRACNWSVARLEAAIVRPTTGRPAEARPRLVFGLAAPVST